MTVFSVIAEVIYEIAKIIGGIAGVAIFIVVLIREGFNQTWSSGNTNFTGIGYGFVMAIVLGLLFVAPLFFFESEYKRPDTDFLTSTFYLKFWIIFLLELIVIAFNLIKDKKRALQFFLYIPLALILAAWCGKTVDLMVFVFNAHMISVFLKIVYLILGLAYLIFYFLIPTLQIRYRIIDLKLKW